MRPLTLSLCISLSVLTTACTKVAKSLQEGKYGSKYGKIEKTAPKAGPFHIDRQNVAVWLDPTTMKDDTDAALASLAEHRDQIGTVRPVMFRLSEGDDPVVPNKNHYQKIQAVYDRLVEIARSTNPPMRIEPTFGNVHGDRVDGDNLRILLKNPERRKEALAFIERIASDPLHSGIDLDWEGLPSEDFHLLADFIGELAPRLHKLGKTLSASLEPWYVNARSKEWKRIGEAADRVTFLGYPAPKEFGPGPIVPHKWLVPHLAEARKAVRGDKFAFGVPLFALEWEDRSQWSNNPEEKWGRYARTWKFVSNPKYVRQRRRDKDGNPSFLVRSCDNCFEILFYEDATSIRRKLALAQKDYGVKSFAMWRIGVEDPAVWDMIK